MFLSMKTKGFTFLEMLITVSLFVILSIIGTSSYTYLVQRNEQQAIIDELRTAIQYAKIQALILGKPVSLSPLDSSLNWSNGMLLTTRNKKKDKMESLYQWQWHHPHWDLNWIGVSSTHKIIFSNNPIQAISNGRFVLTNNHTHKQVAIILNRLGRLRIAYTSEPNLP